MRGLAVIGLIVVLLPVMYREYQRRVAHRS